MTAQKRQVAGTEARHRVRFEITPDALDRVHVWSVGRQILQGDLAALLLDTGVHESRPVRLQAILNSEFAPDGRVQGFREFNDRWILDSAWKRPEVKALETQPRNHRQLLSREAVLHTGVSPRGAQVRGQGRSLRKTINRC